jgi:5-methylcytosine-specific restriction endonuclease McrA
MTWFKVDDKLHAHPKWWALSPNAKALWTTAGAWCASYKTDGQIGSSQLPILAPQVGLTTRQTGVAAAELVAADLWQRTDEGWAFHNWTDFNPPRATIDKAAAIEKERKKIQNDPDLKTAIRVRDQDLCRYCGIQVNFAARTGHTAGRYDHVVPVTKGGKTVLGNVVVCCDFDNRRKYNKTLDEAEMVLLDPGTTATQAELRLGKCSVSAQSKTRPRLGSGPGRDWAGSGQVGNGSGSAAESPRGGPFDDADPGSVRVKGGG